MGSSTWAMCVVMDGWSSFGGMGSEIPDDEDMKAFRRIPMLSCRIPPPCSRAAAGTPSGLLNERCNAAVIISDFALHLIWRSCFHS